MAVPVAELPAPGIYYAASVNGWPLLIVRGRDNVIRAFHNVCRHRGATLLPDGTGTLKAIRCPYHSWSYGLDGGLRAAPRFGDAEALGDAANGLLKVRVEIWNDLVFVCIDEDAPDLLDWLGPLPELCAEYESVAAMEYHGAYVIEGGGNWKTYCDNTLEGYHLSSVHRRLNEAVSDETHMEAYADGRLVVFHVQYRNSDTTLRGATGLWFYRYPGFQGVIGPTGFKAERIEAHGIGETRSTGWHWYRDLDSDARAEGFAWSQQIVLEDLSVCASVQKNLNAGGFTRGVLSPEQEKHTARFQEIVLNALESAKAIGKS